MKLVFQDIQKNSYTCDADASETFDTVFDKLKEQNDVLNKPYKKKQFVYNGKVYSGSQTVGEANFDELSKKTIILFLVQDKTVVHETNPIPTTVPSPPSQVPISETSNPFSSIMQGGIDSVDFLSNQMLRNILLQTAEHDPLLNKMKEKYPEEYNKIMADDDILRIIETRLKPQIITQLATMITGGGMMVGLPNMTGGEMTGQPNMADGNNNVPQTQIITLTEEDNTNVNQIMTITGCDIRQATQCYISAGKNVEGAINFVYNDMDD